MTQYEYIEDIPDGPNNPSEDQPDMKINTNSISSLVDEDHWGFNFPNGGLHRHVRIPAGTIPATVIADSGTLYTKLADGFTQLFYTNGISTQEYQLTRVSTTNNATFAVNGNGWTFLPGGLLLQYGTDTKITGGTVTFPVAFTTFCVSVQCTILANNNNRHFIQVKTKSTTNFTVASRDSSGNDESNTFTWLAIGK